MEVRGCAFACKERGKRMMDSQGKSLQRLDSWGFSCRPYLGEATGFVGM